MIVNGTDLGASIPVCMPAGKSRNPKVFRGYRATKHFVIFENTWMDGAWCVATGHGQRTFGLRNIGDALEMARKLEETGVDWTLYWSGPDYGEHTEAVLSIERQYRRRV